VVQKHVNEVFAGALGRVDVSVSTPWSSARLEKAFADGAVEIFSTAKDRTRTGTGDHAEYYTADQKVILRGSWVRMVEKLFNNPQPNTTEGKEAVYFPNDDRLVMTGQPEKPGNSLINRKKGK